MEKDLEYWKNNCKEDYLHTPISVLRYIKELEDEQNRKAAMLNPPNLDDVLTKQDRGVCKDCYYAGAFTCEH